MIALGTARRFLFAPLLAAVALAPARAAGDEPSPARYAATLTIDGVAGGNVGDLNAPLASSDVITEALGADHVAHKHIGGVKYEDVSFSVGADITPTLAGWISGTFAQTFQRKTVVLTGGAQKRDLFNCLVTEVSFPTMDAASAARVSLGVKIKPEYSRIVAAAGAEPAAGPGFAANMFRVALAGLDTSQITRVDAFSFKSKLTENPVGEQRDYQMEPAKLEVPSVSIYVRPQGAATWLAWHDDFLVKGNSDDAKEKTGTIEYGPAGTAALYRVGLGHVGISRATEVTLAGQRTWKFELYAETMSFAAPNAKVEAAPLKGFSVTPRLPVPGKVPSGRRIP